MRKWVERLALLVAGAGLSTGSQLIVKGTREVAVELVEPPPYRLYLVRDHGQAGRCGVELPKDGTLVRDPRKNEGPRWVRLETEDGYVCDWKIPETLPDCMFQAHGPTMQDVAVKCVYRFSDVDGDGDVDADDAAAVRAMNGEMVTHETCRYDLNLDGRINLIDAAMVR